MIFRIVSNSDITNILTGSRYLFQSSHLLSPSSLYIFLHLLVRSGFFHFLALFIYLSVYLYLIHYQCLFCSLSIMRACSKRTSLYAQYSPVRIVVVVVVSSFAFISMALIFHQLHTFYAYTNHYISNLDSSVLFFSSFSFSPSSPTR